MIYNHDIMVLFTIGTILFILFVYLTVLSYEGLISAYKLIFDNSAKQLVA